jgi:hypothetical protein
VKKIPSWSRGNPSCRGKTLSPRGKTPSPRENPLAKEKPSAERKKNPFTKGKPLQGKTSSRGENLFAKAKILRQ